MALTITQQDKQLLELVAKGESGGDYDIVNTIGRVSGLTSMTLNQVLAEQLRLKASGRSSGAAGKYQFVHDTLDATIKFAGVPRNTLFSPDVQDYLIVQTLRLQRKYDSWKAGGVPDDQFMINLAKEFSSVPVPYDMKGHVIFVKRGQSYYTSFGRNAKDTGKPNTPHNVNSFLQKLADIRKGGPGATITLSEQAATSAAGALPMTQAEIAAGGGQRTRGIQPNQLPMPNSQLPSVSNPYLYVPIAAENNRYDFRTGKKVTDLLVYGTNPMSNFGLTNYTGVADAGREGITAEQQQAATANRVNVGYNTGQVDPSIALRAGLLPGPGTVRSTTIKQNSELDALGKLQ